MMKRFLRRVRAVMNYLAGEWYCAKLHRPLMAGCAGYGGRDVWGRRRREYYSRRCVECGRSWEKAGKPKPLTPDQEKACSDAFGSSWVGDAKKKIKTHHLALTPSEIEQLLAIWVHNLTFAGDLISKDAERSLREKGLVDRMEGWAVATEKGEEWLKCSGLTYKFKKKVGDVR